MSNLSSGWGKKEISAPLQKARRAGLKREFQVYAAHIKFTDTHIMVFFYVCMRERAKKSPFYVAYMQIGNLRIGNLRMRRKKLRKPSYAYMRISYGAKGSSRLILVGLGNLRFLQVRL